MFSLMMTAQFFPTAWLLQRHRHEILALNLAASPLSPSDDLRRPGVLHHFCPCLNFFFFYSFIFFNRHFLLLNFSSCHCASPFSAVVLFNPRQHKIFQPVFQPVFQPSVLQWITLYLPLPPLQEFVLKQKNIAKNNVFTVGDDLFISGHFNIVNFLNSE